MPMQNRKAGRKEGRRGEKNRKKQREKSLVGFLRTLASYPSTRSALFLPFLCIFSCFPFFLPFLS
jgi:hypothetical protein